MTALQSLQSALSIQKMVGEAFAQQINQTLPSTQPAKPILKTDTVELSAEAKTAAIQVSLS